MKVYCRTCYLPSILPPRIIPLQLPHSSFDPRLFFLDVDRTHTTCLAQGKSGRVKRDLERFSMRPKLSNPRAGLSYRVVLIALALVAVVGVVAWQMFKQVDWAPKRKGPMMHVVKRGNFLHEIIERGEVQSASNIDIRCEVQSRGSGGTTILWLIPEGSYVKPGDKLVILDSSSLENEKSQQLITCSSSNAAVKTAQYDLAAAEIAKREYLEGTFVLNENAIKNKIFNASETERQALQTWEYSKGLAKKGYITELRVETDHIAVKRAELDRKSAELELRVLREFTKEKELKQFESSISIVEAKLNSAIATYKVDKDRLDLIQSQIEKCTITAPESGQVVYANEYRRHGGQSIVIEEGVTVRERQTIIRLPDPKRMQVSAKINEAKISLVDEGMHAKIHLDAFSDLELDGVVERVNEYPAPTSFFAGNIKEYEAFVRILGSPAGLKPGLNAEVRIEVESLKDVLTVPVQAIIEHGSRYYCVVPEGGKWRAQEVKIGSTNDEFVVIREGLKENDQVVLAAFEYRDKVKLPKLLKEDFGDGKRSKKSKSRTRSPEKEPTLREKTNPAAPAKPRDPNAFFKQLDKNGDGKIAKDEAPEPIKRFFSNVDKNSDGFIDRSEWNAAARMMQQQGPPGMPQGAGKP